MVFLTKAAKKKAMHDSKINANKKQRKAKQQNKSKTCALSKAKTKLSCTWVPQQVKEEKQRAKPNALMYKLQKSDDSRKYFAHQQK